MKVRLARAMLVAAACCLALTACGSMHMPSVHMPKIWPFYKKPKSGPDAVNELTLLNADGSGATYPQYWVRNTLVIDLSGVSGQGSLSARLPDETTWPVRVAVRVRPGSVGQLEVQAEERNILPVSGEGAKPVDIELASSLYTPKTAAIYIAWGPVPVFAEPAPETPPSPEFVSPTEVPKNSAEGAVEQSEGTRKANDIVSPAEAAQPSPPPGN
ncbi:MAG TPA: hypothetical protein VM146_18410 [Steroidobacteraceae bacterium]|nr:hypothetical protein [Steroidobacteraceae bacterium]